MEIEKINEEDLEKERLEKEQQEKEQFEKVEEYYFLQIYRFLRAYERIFRNLWRKERRLAKQ